MSGGPAWLQRGYSFSRWNLFFLFPPRPVHWLDNTNHFRYGLTPDGKLNEEDLHQYVYLKLAGCGFELDEEELTKASVDSSMLSIFKHQVCTFPFCTSVPLFLRPLFSAWVPFTLLGLSLTASALGCWVGFAHLVLLGIPAAPPTQSRGSAYPGVPGRCVQGTGPGRRGPKHPLQLVDPGPLWHGSPAVASSGRRQV